ncbi:MAG TPA: formyltetrahydrofolate deformylase [Solirubrobacteraceae bacterium]|nr:formyltetrahydrofolate deformylase [Solirubrobacteraceae bacterium]
MSDTGRLLVSCPDQPGIVAAVTAFLRDRGANLTHSSQYSSDPEGGSFFLRVVFHGADPAEIGDAFATEVAAPFGMQFRLTDVESPKRVAIMVSRYDHALLELLWRWQRGYLPARVQLVVSNWPDLQYEVARFGVPYHHIPVTAETKPQAEERQLELLGGGQFDLIVLARYMQVLSDTFLDSVGCPVINIHHSFLPAFAGAAPYARAKERGVKLIGATAHYVTEDLDEGPIIEQDVIRVTHAHTVEELSRLGADIERTVLQRAVTWHCEDRVLTDGNATVVL